MKGSSGSFGHLIDKYVKITPALKGERPIYGILRSEDLHTIGIEFDSGEIILIGKAGVFKCSSWRKP